MPASRSTPQTKPALSLQASPLSARNEIHFEQLSLFSTADEEKLSDEEKPEPTASMPSLDFYDRILVAFSGGKDSIACVLTLLKLGVPSDRIELHHHLVDGREGSSLFDWACTEDYCRKFAAAFNLPIYYSWLEGGFERELNRKNAPKAQTWFETPDKGLSFAGGRGDLDTRLKFPAKVGDLTKRWCSPYLKIDVMDILIRNQPRFYNTKLLVITGERAEESPKRARYKVFDKHRADLRNGKEVQRHIDVWRAVHKLSKTDVWALLEEFCINPHPAYHLGWGRLSCRACIFGSPNQWASNLLIAPDETQKLIDYEEQFNFTIDNEASILEMASFGIPYVMTAQMIEIAMSQEYQEPIILTPDIWTLPHGAFGEQHGPI